MTETVTKAAQVVETYVSETRGWPARTYRVEFSRDDGERLVFWVVNRDDEASRRNSKAPGGGGKSFAVEVDAKRLRVVRELAFQ